MFVAISINNLKMVMYFLSYILIYHDYKIKSLDIFTLSDFSLKIKVEKLFLNMLVQSAMLENVTRFCCRTLFLVINRFWGLPAFIVIWTEKSKTTIYTRAGLLCQYHDFSLKNDLSCREIKLNFTRIIVSNTFK